MLLMLKDIQRESRVPNMVQLAHLKPQAYYSCGSSGEALCHASATFRFATFSIHLALLDWKPCGGRTNESCNKLAPVFHPPYLGGGPVFQQHDSILFVAGSFSLTTFTPQMEEIVQYLHKMEG